MIELFAPSPTRIDPRGDFFSDNFWDSRQLHWDERKWTRKRVRQRAQPFETTLAVTRLIFEGVLERHPGLKIILSHGGGNLVFLRGRLDSAYNAEGWEANPYYRKNISCSPSAYLDRLYYDTCALS
jgi:hypothetical protein